MDKDILKELGLDRIGELEKLPLFQAVLVYTFPRPTTKIRVTFQESQWLLDLIDNVKPQ